MTFNENRSCIEIEIILRDDEKGDSLMKTEVVLKSRVIVNFL